MKNAQRYINEILNPFFVNLAPAEGPFGYYTQDGATPHTAKGTIQALCGVFGKINGEDRLLERVYGPQDPKI
jgi:hypothetical protein